MFIDGARYTPSGSVISIQNPATGEVIDIIHSAVPEDVTTAVSSCSTAFESWSQKSYAERGAILFQMSAALKDKENLEKLAVLLTKEQGKPITESRREIDGVIRVIDYFVGLSSSIHTDFFENKSNDGCSFTIQKPLGICASVLPWNMPALIMAWKIMPALLTGNVCIVKPSSFCPLTVLELASVFHEAGLPSGVLNIVIGSGEIVGRQLAESSAVAKISFTGSAAAGRNLYEAAAKTNKRVTLELGGSDAMIVCDDADVENCADKAVSARFFNCGQACISPKRIFVFESVFDEFVAHALHFVSQINLGNGLLETTTMGPLSSKHARDEMIEYIKAAKAEGVQILAGGNVPDSAALQNGAFFEPTVIVRAPPNSGLLTEEIFGPIMVINPVSDLEEAIIEANNTVFGLGASIWTNDIRRAKIGVEKLNAGVVWVNQHAKVLPELPFGGVKESGFGRENGYAVLNDYLETKTVVLKF